MKPPKTGTFADDHITVTRSEGSRGADGYEETDATVVLDCDADVQSQGRAFRERAAYFETGDALAFAEDDVSDVSVGDSVTVTRGGTDTTGTVAEVMPLDDSLLITLNE